MTYLEFCKKYEKHLDPQYKYWWNLEFPEDETERFSSFEEVSGIEDFQKEIRMMVEQGGIPAITFYTLKAALAIFEDRLLDGAMFIKQAHELIKEEKPYV